MIFTSHTECFISANHCYAIIKFVYDIDSVAFYLSLTRTHINFNYMDWQAVNYLHNATVEGREPWSSGFGRRLTFQRSWVWNLAPDTGWTWHFFTLICCKNCIVCLKRPKINEKEAQKQCNCCSFKSEKMQSFYQYD